MDLRAMKTLSILALALFALASCDGPADTDGGKATRNVPSAVRYDQYGAANNLAPPAEDLVNPYSGDPDAAEQGALLFSAMNCDGCHGGGGVGFVGPSLVDGRWRHGGEDGALFHSIFYGRSHGMPAYGGLITEGIVWQLVTYVRSQPLPAVVPTVSWP